MGLLMGRAALQGEWGSVRESLRANAYLGCVIVADAFEEGAQSE